MTDYTPAVPNRIRTIAYVAGLVIATLAVLVIGLADVWLGADLAGKVRESVGVVTAATALVTGALGVAYRPTKALT